MPVSESYTAAQTICQTDSHSPWGHIRDMPRSSSTSSLSQSHCETKFGNGSSRRKSRTKLKHSHCASVTRLKLKKIRGYAQEVQSNDKTNRESIAASEYFKALLPYGTRWNGPMTAPLNYGYAILRSGIAQCAVSHGWLVSRGIHHHSAENAFNLVDDLIEPFRPIVDLKVVSDNILEPLSTQNKKALTEITSVLVSIDGRRHSVQTAIDIYCESLRRAVELKDAGQLLLPDIIGLERETYEEKRAKGKV